MLFFCFGCFLFTIWIILYESNLKCWICHYEEWASPALGLEHLIANFRDVSINMSIWAINSIWPSDGLPEFTGFIWLGFVLVLIGRVLNFNNWMPWLKLLEVSETHISSINFISCLACWEVNILASHQWNPELIPSIGR